MTIKNKTLKLQPMTLARPVICAGLLAAALPASAKDAGYPEVAFRELPSAEWRGDTLTLHFEAALSRKLKSPEIVELHPIYVEQGDTLQFPSVCFMTGSGEKYRKRHEGDFPVSPRRVTVIQGRRGFAPFSYTRSVTGYRRQNGSLEILCYYRSCCDLTVTSTRDIPMSVDKAYATGDSRFLPEGMPTPAVDMPDSPLPVPRQGAALPLSLTEANVSLFRPLAEKLKKRSGDAVMHLNYPVNHSRIYAAFGDNARELAFLDSVLSPLNSDPAAYGIRSITIRGYASPEDTWAHNLKLSQRRADGLKDYIVENYMIDPLIIRSEGMGEDWDGLRKSIMRTQAPAKGAMLRIIDSLDIFEGREKKMMDLNGGEPYKWLLRNLYPPLRRLEARIDYTVRPFEEEEVARVIRTRPADMSLLEMWQVAKEVNNDTRIAEDRERYGAEYYIMARYFPDNEIANINAASAALIRGNLEDARTYLSKVADSPLSANDIGVYYWMCGMPAEARAYFNIARAVDPDRANWNLAQLSAWESYRGR
ncbi:MAG: hypothetical protein K2O56_05895 [Muribaculaceae bacterium]|nr:hypothetical protein [Muribaculaceae bacterium]